MKHVLNIQKLTPLELAPSAKRAMFPTDVAAKIPRPCNKEAFVHVLDEEL
jgi:hypothetical protein